MLGPKTLPLHRGVGSWHHKSSLLLSSFCLLLEFVFWQLLRQPLMPVYPLDCGGKQHCLADLFSTWTDQERPDIRQGGGAALVVAIWYIYQIFLFPSPDNYFYFLPH